MAPPTDWRTFSTRPSRRFKPKAIGARGAWAESGGLPGCGGPARLSCDAEEPVNRAIGLTAALALGVAACAGPSTQGVMPERDTPLTETLDGLRQRPIDGPGAVFVATPPPEWRRFGRVEVEAPRIEYAPHSARPTDADAERLRGQLRQVLERALAEEPGWLPVAEGANHGVLRVRSAISDLDLRAPAVSSIRTTAFQAPSGRVGFVLELEDAARGTPLLRFGERRPLPGGTFVGPPWTELQRTREAFRRFALDARAAIAQVAGASAGR